MNKRVCIILETSSEIEGPMIHPLIVVDHNDMGVC